MAKFEGEGSSRKSFGGKRKTASGSGSTGRPKKSPSSGGKSDSKSRFNSGSSDRPKRSFGSKSGSFGDKPRFGKPEDGDRPKRSFGGRSSGSFGDKPRFSKPEDGDRPKRSFGGRSSGSFGDKPRFSKPEDGDRPKRSFGGRSSGSFGDKPRFSKPEDGDRPKRSFGGRSERSFGDKPRFSKPEGGDGSKRSFGGRSSGRTGDNPRFSKPENGERPKRSFSGRSEGSSGDNPRFSKPEEGDRPKRSFGGRSERSSGDNPRFSKPEDGERPKRSYDGRGRSTDEFGNKPRFNKAEDNDRPKRAYGAKSDSASEPKKTLTNKKTFLKKEFGDAPRFTVKKGPGRTSDFSKDFDSKENDAFIDEDNLLNDEDKAKLNFNRKSTVKGGKPKSKSGQEAPEKSAADGIRLNRYIANAGICSRREADVLISDGLIKVDGKVVSELGYIVKPGESVKYGNKVLNREKMVYLLLNKPKDFLTTTNDPEERKTVMALIANACKERIYPVGRLDRQTTGLLLFTNDGELTEKLTHPSHEIKKIYQVELNKPISTEDAQSILDGLHFEEGKAKVDSMAVLDVERKTVGIEIHIGWNRIVRRLFEAKGYEIVKLDRMSYAGLTKKDLTRGHWRNRGMAPREDDR